MGKYGLALWEMEYQNWIRNNLGWDGRKDQHAWYTSAV